ncbi:MAG: hydrogenase maturation nickel metallochaperone HypA [Nocardioides sp.]|nr:hydrogenase maturation nickel metallochaperone HypA [Nocardioides sp.]
MHELSIAEAIVDTVTQRTAERRVEVVRVRVGKLMAVVADALLFCFDLATQGTPLEGARLEVDETDALVHCRSCDQDSVVADLILLCGCGSADVAVLAGRELQVSSVEVV